MARRLCWYGYTWVVPALIVVGSLLAATHIHDPSIRQLITRCGVGLALIILGSGIAFDLHQIRERRRERKIEDTNHRVDVLEERFDVHLARHAPDELPRPRPPEPPCLRPVDDL